MKTTSKLLCLILAIMMMLPMIASCDLFGKKGNDDNGGSNGGDTPAEVRDEVYTMTGLEDKTFDGEKFTIGYSFGGGAHISEWIPKPINPKTDEIQTNIVAEASFKRDSRFEQLTGARLVYNGYATNPNTYKGEYSESANFINLQAGNLLAEYDLLMFGATTAGKLISEKVLLDLNEYDNLIHHDRNYYTATINKQLSMAGKQFATAGYYTTGNIRGTQITCVNNTALTNQHGEDLKQELYDLALNNEWTLEKLLSYDAGFATGTVKNDETDQYTLLISQFGCENFYYAMGGTIVQKNNQDLPYVTVNSYENRALLDSIRNYTSTDLIYIARESGSGAMFNKGQSLFQIGMLGAYGSARTELGIDECLMPVPMETAGGEYNSFIPTWNTNVSGIPVQAADAETSAYFYELYMALSYNYIYPAFYEKTMKLNYAQNATEAKIFDEIAKTVCLDVAAVYTWVNENNTDIRNIVDNKSETNSTTDSLAGSVQTKINEFLGNYNAG